MTKVFDDDNNDDDDDDDDSCSDKGATIVSPPPIIGEINRYTGGACTHWYYIIQYTFVQVIKQGNLHKSKTPTLYLTKLYLSDNIGLLDKKEN